MSKSKKNKKDDGKVTFQNFVAKHAHLAGRAGSHEKSNKAKRKKEKQNFKKDYDH